jgi:putative flippase GtrA
MLSKDMRVKNPSKQGQRGGAAIAHKTVETAKPSQVRRWINFYAVGALGFAVQIVTLATLKGLLGVDYLVATGLAVEVSVLHNFLWHERWTWADRTGTGHGGVFDRLVRFHAATAIISIVGNMVGTWLLVTAFELHYLVANLLAVLSCSILNFFVSDLMVFRKMREEAVALPLLTREQMMSGGLAVAAAGATEQITSPAGAIWREGQLKGAREMKRTRSRKAQALAAVLAVLMASTSVGPVHAAELKSKTVEAWDAYVMATERRIVRELASEQGFLVMDFQARARSVAERRALMSGEVLVSDMKTLDSTGEDFDVPGGMIHHWSGAVFIPDVTVEEVMARVSNPNQEDTKQQDVLASEVLDRGPGYLRMYLKLQRKKFVTVTFNTEHMVKYQWHGEGRASSSSATTKIAEVVDVGKPTEAEKPVGNDSGFLWRLNSYWRYEQVEGGVIVELESLSLSRTVPMILKPMVSPLIRSAAKGSVDRTLSSMRDRFIRFSQQRIELTDPADVQPGR